jgi:hypothetical protein
MIGSNKAVAAGAVGASVAFLGALLNWYGIQVPADVSNTAIAFLSTIAVWFTPHGGDTPPTTPAA